MMQTQIRESIFQDSLSHRIHGIYIYLPTFTIKCNHSCSYTYTSPMDPMGIVVDMKHFLARMAPSAQPIAGEAGFTHWMELLGSFS